MSAMDGVSQDWVSTSTHDGVSHDGMSHDGVSSVVDWVGINARFLVSFFSFFSKSTTLYSFLISLMDLKIPTKLVTIPSNTTTDLLKFKNGSLNFKRLHSMVPRRNVCKILTYSKCSRCSFLRKRCTCLSIPLPYQGANGFRKCSSSNSEIGKKFTVGKCPIGRDLREIRLDW